MVGLLSIGACFGVLIMSLLAMASLQDDEKPENIYCIGSVPGRDLRYIYHGAELFVFPSFQEGFGIPVIEAFASGVPVITSNVSSLPEITQGGAIEVEPGDIDAIAASIKMGLCDESLRKRNIAFGLEIAAQFTVKRMAQRVLNIYEKILE